MNQEKYWDEIAEKKDFPTTFRLKEFKKHVHPKMSVLDMGCGYGRTLNELYHNGFRNLTGLDYSQGMINRGLRLHPHLNLIKNNGDNIPFPDSFFDSALFIGVLTSNIRDETPVNLISEISRVLKCDGIYTSLIF